MPQFPHKVDIGTLQHVYVFQNILFHKPYTSELFLHKRRGEKLLLHKACSKIILKIKQFRIGYENLDF